MKSQHVFVRNCVGATLLFVVSFLSSLGISHCSETRAIGSSIRVGRIEVTPEYSNAALIAIVPRIAECAEKLGVSLPARLTTNHVADFWPAREVYGDRRIVGEQVVSAGIGGYVLLTNGMAFEFDRGRMVKFERRAKEDGSKAVLAKEIRFNPKQALEIARRSIEAMGCGIADVHADLAPEVQEPKRVHGKLYALYYFHWNNPAIERSSLSAEVRINGETGEADYVWLLGAPALAAPELTVRPTIVPRSDGGINLSDEETEAACQNFLPKINEVAGKLGLPIELPVTIGSVKWMGAVNYDGTVHLSVLLTNGYRFRCDLGRDGFEFSAPDAFFCEPHVKAREFFGKWQISRKSALKMAREAVAKLDLDREMYSTKGKPEIEKPYLAGEALIPRYWVRWGAKKRECVVVEIDAENGRVTQLSYGPNGMEIDLPVRVRARTKFESQAGLLDIPK